MAGRKERGSRAPARPDGGQEGESRAAVRNPVTPPQSLTERWVRLPAQGRRRRRPAQPACPHRISPPSRTQEPPPLPRPLGRLMSHAAARPQSQARQSPMAAPRRVPQSGPLPLLSPAPAHKYTRVCTRPWVVPEAPAPRRPRL